MSIKKSKTLFCVVVLALLCCASCKKDKATEMVELRIALEQPTDPSDNQKVYLDNQNLVNWYKSYTYTYGLSVNTVKDQIKINSSELRYVENYKATVPSSNNGYTAVYPAVTTSGDNNTANNGVVTVTIPAVQKYIPGPTASDPQNLKDLPMGAYICSNDINSLNVLMFRNLASLIKVTVHNPYSHPYRLNSIKLSSTNGKALHGTFEWTFSQSSNNHVPNSFTDKTSTVNPGNTYRSEIMLDFNHVWKTIPANGSESFYMVVAPFSGCNFKIQVRGAELGSDPSDGYSNGEAIKIHTKNLGGNKTLNRSIIGKINANLPATAGSGYTISGGFNVGSKQSYFSIGNLSLGYSTPTDYTWCFNTNVMGEQYDCMGPSNNASWWQLSDKSEKYLDLFPYNFVQSSYDVGTYFPINDSYADQGLFRCPKYSEWRNILLLRSASTVNGTSNAHFAKATVNGKNGLVLFPDDYCQPSGITVNSVNNDNNANYSDNVYSYQAWKLMEAAGAVFLPAAGRFFDYSSYNNLGYYVYTHDQTLTGYYWGSGTPGMIGDFGPFDTYSRVAFNNSSLQNNTYRFGIENVEGIEATDVGIKTLNLIYISIRPIRD